MPVETRRIDFAAVVLPGVGVGHIRFGASPHDVMAALGPPADDYIDEDGDRMLEYPELGVSFFIFAHDEDMRLVAYELSPDSDAELWGSRIFRLRLAAISEAASARGLVFAQRSGHADEEEALYQVRSLSLDFYFESGRLSALTPGVVFSGDDAIQWPTAP